MSAPIPEVQAISAFVPILRSFDESQTRDFYLRYLGFDITFEHRFGTAMPLYMGVQLGGLELHLSEHHGDATPGSAVRIEMPDVTAYHRAVSVRGHPRANPGVQDQDWGWREMSVTDPSGNRLIFCSPLDAA